MKKLILLSLAVSSFIFAQTPKVYWVDVHNGNDGNNGLTSSTAFKTIQYVFSNANSLLSSSTDDTIKVLPSITSSNPDGYYDFGGNEININSSRNFVMIGIAGADSTIFNAEEKNRHFQINTSQDESTVIQGIKFINGKKDYSGGSIYLSESSISFKNCIFENNSVTDQGGAIYIAGQSTPSFESCSFVNNKVLTGNTDQTGEGGAIYITNPSSSYSKKLNSINFTNTKFISNYVLAGGSAFGGAIKAQRKMNFTNCLFIKNHSTSNTNDNNYDESLGGAIHADNWYWDGGQRKGLDMIIMNSTFDGNYIKAVTDDKLNVMWGSTISYGRWEDYISPSAKTYIFNSIIRNSKIYTKSSTFSNDGNGRGDLIGAGSSQGYKLITDYNNIVGSSQESWAGDFTYDVEPGYKDTANGDYSLLDASPMIGLGVATWADEGLTAPTKDILGNARGSSPDLGSYENSLSAANAPLPVSGLSVSAITSGAKLIWNRNRTSLTNTSLASNIEYQIQKDSSGVKTVFTTSDTTYSFQNLKNGKTYSFIVNAKDTQTGNLSISSKSFTITPRYLGPKWYVGAGSDGSPLSSQASDFDWGSKSSPINNLTTALDVYSAGDTIVMMKGTHTGSSNRGITIPNNNKSFVLTGDLDHPASETIIDAAHRDRHLYFNGGQDTSWVVERITLYRGKASGSSWQSTGGSVRLENASPRFKNVIFRENKDETNQSDGAGAITVSSSALLLLDNCSFINNSVVSNDNSGTGGAIYLNSDPVNKKHLINGCHFEYNFVSATYNAQGSALFIRDATDIINSVFVLTALQANKALAQGTIFYEGPDLSSGNSSNGTSMNFINNTVANNSVTSTNNNSSAAAIYYCDWVPGQGRNSSTLYAFNNIIYGNKDNGSIDEHQIEAHCGGSVIVLIIIIFIICQKLVKLEIMHLQGLIITITL